MKKWFFLFLLLAVIAGGVAGYGVYKVRQLADSPLAIEQDSFVTLEAGTGRLALARQLYQDKLIRQPRVFQWLLKVEPELANFKAGTYQLTPGMTVRQMLALFASGKEAQFPIRFVPGMRLKDLLAELRTAPFIKHQLTDDSYESVAKALGVDTPEALEGRFYPDTWMYTAGTSDIAILKRTQQKMTDALDKVWESRQKDLPYKNKLELLTMASIIEKETGLANERDTVASVFINRLDKGMRLQTDPTVIYGMGERYTGKITREALQTATPYNTYVIPGLPPGPIAIPSQASLQSAAHPGDTPYLYFVADGKGGHTFSTTLNNHNKAVQVYIQSLKEKNGQ